MKRKTYNNVIKASRLIMKKGYEQKFDCSVDDVAIGCGTLKGFVFLRETLLEE